jgi:hypothetical protein
VRVLHDRGLLKKAGTRSVRGALQHYSRLRKRRSPRMLADKTSGPATCEAPGAVAPRVATPGARGTLPLAPAVPLSPPAAPFRRKESR